MIREDRLAAIADRLVAEGRVVAVDLAAVFAVPVDTIRRDLRDLAARGVCRRVYGGALRNARPGAAERRPAALPALAAAAARHVRAGSLVFIDAGRTNLAIAEALPEDAGLTVVTTSPAIAAALVGRRGLDLVMIGGRISPVSGSALGAIAQDAVRDLRADLCLLGACAVAAEGISAFDIEDAALKRTIAAGSEQVLVAATADKVGTRAPFPIAPLTAIDLLLVEAGAPAAELSRIRDAGLPMEVVPAEA
jgi:DeoR/GlpR family transcriptional regulator of sugar metabolism